MRIDPTKEIAGYSSLLIRKLLRDAIEREWDVSDVQFVMGFGSRKAKRLLSDLEELGYIEPAPARRNGRKKRWKNSTLGNHFAVSPASKPITRATAEKRIGELMERVKVVRDDPYYLYRVERVTLFGSILSDQATLGDVDVAVSLVRKEPDTKRAQELDSVRRREAANGGRRFGTKLDYWLWPQVEVFLFLKSRARSLSLGLENAEFLKKCETEVIYRDEAETSAT